MSAGVLHFPNGAPNKPAGALKFSALLLGMRHCFQQPPAMVQPKETIPNSSPEAVPTPPAPKHPRSALDKYSVLFNITVR